MYETEYYFENGMECAKITITVSVPRHVGVTSALQAEWSAAIKRMYKQMAVYE